jgi:predicted ArsR family transcriptional regulator
MEWEASLQPHQRSLHDSLMRVSKRVLRHVVDNETAVTDIADVYETDGEQVLQEVLARQNGACAELWRDMGAKKKKLQEDMESSVEVLARERKRVGSIV